ncbi:hypothetical protein EJB05_24642 [Eragrostis curvula]|uniref:Uncharacterized protein n=1 Tax=Eragrostis curvula TaxID=38414 RepID=A0A5J9V9U3_9POAL|nr:hypothetical protein EJB05_24642 [Eragrostis curvula]
MDVAADKSGLNGGHLDRIGLGMLSFYGSKFHWCRRQADYMQEAWRPLQQGWTGCTPSVYDHELLREIAQESNTMKSGPCYCVVDDFSYKMRRDKEVAMDALDGTQLHPRQRAGYLLVYHNIIPLKLRLNAPEPNNPPCATRE